MVIISVERYLSVSYPAKSKCMKKRKHQRIIAFCVLLSSFLYYIPILIYRDLISELFDGPKICTEPGYHQKDIIFVLEMLHNTILPFFFMSIFTVLMLKTLLNSRADVSKYFDSSVKRKNKLRDIRFSTTVIFNNLMFLAMKMPYTIINYFYMINCGGVGMSTCTNSFFEDSYYGTLALFLSTHAVSVLINFCSNKLFRKELNKSLKSYACWKKDYK